MKTPIMCLKIDLLKNARFQDHESARAMERDFTLALALKIAFSSLAFSKTSKFQTGLRFSFENLAFLFLNKKARFYITSGPNGTP